MVWRITQSMASAGNDKAVATTKNEGQPIDSASTPASGPTQTRPTRSSNTVDKHTSPLVGGNGVG